MSNDGSKRQLYSVGICNLEVPVPAPSTAFGHALLVKNQQPALQLETVLFTLYYPSTALPVAPLQRMTWLQRPLLRTVRGYANFSQRSPYLMFPILATLFGAKKLNGYVNQPLVGIDEAKEAIPFVVFSHGLGGTKTTYSEYCTALASSGYIVAAVESRDGSAPISIVSVAEKDGTISEKVIDYLRIEDITFPAPHRTLTLNEFRADQLRLRVAEVEALLEVVARINAGEGDAIERENVLQQKVSQAAGLKHWKSRIDERLFLAGHSFGGATLLQVLRNNPKRSPFIRAIALDPWVDPIAALDPPRTSRPSNSASSSISGSSTTTTLTDEAAIGNEINCPLLVINSEPFTLWTPHFNKVRDIINGVGRENGREEASASSWLVTIVGSIHLSFSDFPLALPARLVQYFVPSNRINPSKAMALVVQMSLEFLAKETESERSVLVGPVKKGDEEGRRAGEGYKREGLAMMESVGDVRLHIRPVEKL